MRSSGRLGPAPAQPPRPALLSRYHSQYWHARPPAAAAAHAGHPPAGGVPGRARRVGHHAGSPDAARAYKNPRGRRAQRRPRQPGRLARAHRPCRHRARSLHCFPLAVLEYVHGVLPAQALAFRGTVETSCPRGQFTLRLATEQPLFAQELLEMESRARHHASSGVPCMH